MIDEARKIYGNSKNDSVDGTVMVTVTDLNDHGPRWVIAQPRVEIREDITKGRPVPRLLATVIDEDQVNNRIKAYWLRSKPIG